jgi:hypothetical protein
MKAAFGRHTAASSETKESEDVSILIMSIPGEET